MAQLGARLSGRQKVRGSNPLISTNKVTHEHFVRLFVVRNGFA